MDCENCLKLKEAQTKIKFLIIETDKDKIIDFLIDEYFKLLGQVDYLGFMGFIPKPQYDKLEKEVQELKKQIKVEKI